MSERNKTGIVFKFEKNQTTDVNAVRSKCKINLHAVVPFQLIKPSNIF